MLISFCWFQEVANKLAKLAVRACARLGGYLTGQLESPNNSVTQEILNRLLTPYLARHLSLDKPEEVSQAQRKLLLNLTYCVSLHNSCNNTKYFMCPILIYMKEETKVLPLESERGSSKYRNLK
jgi:hypothetical protein